MVGPNWLVQAEVSCPIPISVATGNVLLVGVQPSESIGCTTLPIIGSGNSIVWIFESAAQGTGNPVSVVNGFDLYRAAQDHAKGYLVPALGIEILWRGANPAAVISTLGWSPLHYVLSFGGSEPPSFWKRYYFDGVSVAAPPSWPVKEPLVLVCSGPFDHGPVVGLGVHVIPVPCPYMAPPTTPTDGVLVTPTDQIGDCPIRGIMLVAGMESTVCSDPSLQPPELEVKLVFGSGSTTHRVYVTVGLGATAMVARQIIGSLAGIVPVAARVG